MTVYFPPLIKPDWRLCPVRLSEFLRCPAQPQVPAWAKTTKAEKSIRLRSSLASATLGT